MHEPALAFIKYVIGFLGTRRRVCELGGRDVHQAVRELFRNTYYVGLAREARPRVDLVADPASWSPEPPASFDTVVCVEVLEHTPEAARICLNAFNLLDAGGVFIVTAGSIGRPPRSEIDGEVLGRSDFYRNVSPFLMEKWLSPFKFVRIDARTPGDVYAVAVR